MQAIVPLMLTNLPYEPLYIGYSSLAVDDKSVILSNYELYICDYELLYICNHWW